MGVWIVWNLEPLASSGQSSPKLIPHIICQFLYAWEKNSERGLILQGIKCQPAPSSHKRHSSLEKYTSYIIERVVYERELETEQNCNILNPHSYGHNSVSFPFSWAAQPAAWGPSLSGTWSPFQHLLSNCNCLIVVLRGPSAGCWFSLSHLISNWLELSVHRVIPLIPSTGFTCYLHRCISYFAARPGSICNKIWSLRQNKKGILIWSCVRTTLCCTTCIFTKHLYEKLD